MPKRGTKAYREEIVETYYGIHPATKRVQAVSRTRDGVLTAWTADERYITHPIKPGWSGEAETRLIFGLREIIAVRAGQEHTEYTKKRIEALGERAANWSDETTPGEPDARLGDRSDDSR